MENKSIHCTLTDAELTAKADKWIYDLCHGASWIMHVPARPNEDPDLILSELNNRFKERLKAQPGPRWVKASDRLPEKGGKENSVIVRGVFKEPGYNEWPFVAYGFRNFHPEKQEMYFELGSKSYLTNDVEWLDEQPAAVTHDAHEKEVMMQAFAKVRQIFEGREWIMEGRGSYPYNDDRYKEEVRYMYNEFDKVVKDTWANINSKSIEYREWIISEYLQKDHPAIPDILKRIGYQRVDEQPAAGREEDAVAFHDWVLENEWEINYREQRTHTTAELYELFKQKEK